MQSGKSINIRQHNQPAGITPQRKKHIFVTNQNVTEIFEQDSLKRMKYFIHISNYHPISPINRIPNEIRF